MREHTEPSMKGKVGVREYATISDQGLIPVIDSMTFDHGLSEMWLSGPKRKL